MFINIHTHQQTFDAKVELVSLNPDEEARVNTYSYGLHPWKISQDNYYMMEKLNRVSRNKRCVAIGECGLDKAIDTNFEIQLNVLIEHIILANKINKPLIIHCVKAHNELIQVLKKQKNKVPVIIHGFNNNMNIAHMLLNEGCFLSFGKALLTYESNASEVLKQVGRNNFFLETDDSDISIKYIYKKAAELLGIEEEILREQLRNNYHRVFKEEIH